MSYEINKAGWKIGSQPNTGYLAYFSTHKVVLYNGFSQPSWMIVKEGKGYMLYTFIHGGYHRLTGFQHHRLLKDVKYYCDVEVERFNNGQ